MQGALTCLKNAIDPAICWINLSPNSEGVEIFATSGHAGYQEYGTSKMGAHPQSPYGD